MSGEDSDVANEVTAILREDGIEILLETKTEAVSAIGTTVHLGDKFSVGSAEVIVTQPRLPCYKPGVKFQSDDMVKQFLASGRMGFYVAVTREGEVGGGDEFRVIARDFHAVPVSEITRLYIAKRYGVDELNSVRRALQVVAVLPESWKEYFRERLQHTRVG